jgi:hypothetical protein
MKLLRCDSTDYGDFFEAAVELMRGHSESGVKSMRNGAAWERKRRAAREGGAVITHRLPAWVEEHDGKLRLIPDCAAVVKRIFQLSASGYGAARIVKRLTGEKVPAFGASGRWTRAYIGLILHDRRVIGEFQPRKVDGTADGPPIPNYYPPAVTEEQFYAARAQAGVRRQKAGQVGKRVELFSGLLKHARDGGSYYVATRTDGGKHSRVLLNTDAAEGRAPSWSFPLATFEAAVLGALAEINPHEILNGDSGPDESLTLAGQLADVEGELAEAAAFMDAHGFSATIGKRVTELEARQRDLTARLAVAREKAAHPLSETWGEAQSLLGAINAAADPTDMRLRLRAALRRIIDSIWLLIVPRGRDRLCAVQVWFSDGKRRREYLILHRPAKANASARTESQWWARSLAEVAPADLDLRQREDARLLEEALATVDLSSVPASENTVE